MIRKALVFLTFVSLCTAPCAFAAKGSGKLNVFPLPPTLSAKVELSEPSGNNMLDGEETGKLIITIKNTGKGDAFDVRAEITAERKVSGLEFDGSTTIGSVAAGETVTKEIMLKASKDIPTADISLNINLREANGFDPDPTRIAFRTKAFETPNLIVADIGMDKPKVRAGETVEVTLRIQNAGQGDARSVTVDIENGENVFLAGDSKNHFNLGALSAGKYKDVKFDFYTNKRIRNGERVPLTVRINEERTRYRYAKTLDIIMDAPQKQIDTVVVKGEGGKPKGPIEIAGGLSVDTDTKIPEGLRAGEYDVAVVIGNKHYQSESGAPDVEYADRDAMIMKEYLIKAFGFNEKNIIYAEDARLSKFNEIFGSAADYKGDLYYAVKPDVSNVFVYYVGHGAPDLNSQEAYFVPVDAKPRSISTNGYKLQTFYNNIAKIPARKITIVLDSCFSGNSSSGSLFQEISPSMVKVKDAYRGAVSNTVLITSAAIDQVSSWYPEKRHSLFSYYFFKAVQGAADYNKDNKISVAELKKYLKDNVPYMSGKLHRITQQPVVMGDDLDIIVTLKK